MIEQQWLSSEDPKAMLDYLESQGLDDERRCRYFVEACRAEWTPSLIGYPDLDYVVRNNVRFYVGASDIGIPAGWDRACSASFCREIWGNPFRPVRFAHAGYKALGTGYSAKGQMTLLSADYLTYDVLTLAQIIRQGNHEAYEPLWDALYAAGCDNEEIRQHCAGRERCPTCCGLKRHHKIVGSGVRTEQTYSCDDCNGTGWIPLRCQHVAGCWCIQLILGDE